MYALAGLRLHMKTKLIILHPSSYIERLLFDPDTPK